MKQIFINKTSRYAEKPKHWRFTWDRNIFPLTFIFILFVHLIKAQKLITLL